MSPLFPSSHALAALTTLAALASLSGCRTAQAPTPDVAVLPGPTGGGSASAAVLAQAGKTPQTDTETEPTEPPHEEAHVAPENVPQGDTCDLRATLRELPATDGYANYALTLTNGGKKAVRLVVPGDGSEAGWRTPALTWIGTANGKPAVHGTEGRCGMMNSISSREIFTLEPGASRELKEWVGSPSFVSGKYDVRLRYRNDPKLLARKSSAKPDVALLLAQTSSCDVTSNSITTKVR